jgi:hypothetical protein
MLAGPGSRISLPRTYLAGSPCGLERLTLDRGFRVAWGYLAESPSPFRCLTSNRGFRDHQSSQASKEVGASHPELLLRHLPGQPRQRGRHPRRIHRLDGVALRPLLRAPGHEVARVHLPPRRLIAPPQLTPALRLVARALAIAHPWIGHEALLADHASPMSLPRRGHPSFLDDPASPWPPGLLLPSTPRPFLTSAPASTRPPRTGVRQTSIALIALRCGSLSAWLFR